MDIPESYKWYDIKRRVIEPALKELILKNNLVIEWEPKKKGRSIYSLYFQFIEQLKET